MTPITEWRVVDTATGEVTDAKLNSAKRRGRKPSVKAIHGRVTKAVQHRAPRNSVRLMMNGTARPMLAGGVEKTPFSGLVEARQGLLRKRRHPLSAEEWLPDGPAALWYADVIQCVPRSGQKVARQLARLCGADSQVTVPRTSLADAVGVADKDGRLEAYTQRGIDALIEAGWLRTETTGPVGNQETTYYLMPGDRRVEWFPEDDDEWQAMRL